MAGIYRGRFAPSPTGPLHLGSLVAAVGSYLDARAHSGEWLVRIEDIDPPRENPSAASRILHTLRAHALQWDEEVLFQSARAHAYSEAIDRLECQGSAFRCTCSRAELERSDGTHELDCPAAGGSGGGACSIRIASIGLPPGVHDLLLGPVDWRNIDLDGSFIVRRRDGLFAYHLAVVVDDAFQSITHVIRGRDLLESTPFHILLQQLLGLPTPAYGHLPLILDDGGSKLSKQSLAEPIDDDRAPQNLVACLRALGQPLPPGPARQSCQAVLEWATSRWDRTRLPSADLVARELDIWPDPQPGGNGAGP